MSTNQVMIPVTTAGPAGWPPMSCTTTADMMAAAIPRRASRSGRPRAMRAGSSQQARASRAVPALAGRHLVDVVADRGQFRGDDLADAAATCGRLTLGR